MFEAHPHSHEALIKDPLLHEHARHGLTVTLIILSGLISTTSNVMSQYRFASAMGNPVTEKGVADPQKRMDQLCEL